MHSFSINYQYFDSLNCVLANTELVNRNIWLTNPHEGISCYDKAFSINNSILVLGEEAFGIKNLSANRCVTIPTTGKVESLNVAQAATIFLYEGFRQQLNN